MSKKMLPLLVALVCMVGIKSAVSQSFEDFIIETRGDTVVVIDAIESGQNNTLVDAVELDASAPEGRVYELVPNGIYWFTRNLNTPTDRPLMIVGADNSRLVQRDNSELRPPNLHGTTVEGAATNGGFFNFRHDLTIKNIVSSASATDNSQGWAWADAGNAGRTLTLENVHFEHNNWIFIQSNAVPNTNLHIRDSYFVNMSGEPCRRNGGVFDADANHPLGELIVENSTHVMAQGMMYKFRGNYFSKAFINHNTFVNASGQLFASMGYHTTLTVTNNLFVNSNVQGYFPGLDFNETDQDNLPHGIINVNHLPAGNAAFEGYSDADRKILVYNNGVFWDDRLNDIVVQLNNNQAQGRADWVSQMMTMNTRTQEIFDDNARYPLMNEGNWVMGGDPGFIEPRNLMTDMVTELINFSVDTGDEGTYVLPKWRMPGNETARGGDDGLMPYPDWPVPVNLAYSNSEYLTAGLGDMPLGDLNWFPESKTQFNELKDELYAELEAALNEGRDPHYGETSAENPGLDSQNPKGFELAQNYPNPFNPTTQIRFTLQNSADVKLDIFDVTGRLIATLINDSMNAGSHMVTWNATNNAGMSVASGVYIYRLTAGEEVQSRKMTLIK